MNRQHSSDKIMRPNKEKGSAVDFKPKQSRSRTKKRDRTGPMRIVDGKSGRAMVTRRELALSSLSFATVIAAGGVSSGLAKDSELSRKLALAARRFVVALSAAGRSKAVMPFASPVRFDWHYFPRSRPGLTLGEMNDRERAALWSFLGETLSPRGIEQVRGVIKLEQVLGELTGNRAYRDPDNYAIVLFGDPSNTDRFAWRFEGHHLSVSVFVAEGSGIAVTPSFVGANPAKVPNGHRHAGFRLLGEQEDQAFQLIRSIEGKAREQTIISNRSLGDIVAGPGREEVLQRFEGIPLAKLSEGQRDGVYAILGLYAGTMKDEIARAALSRVRADGASQLHFAWAGSMAPGRAHYFRIHGPSVLVEYDNTQDGANHVHSVWIDPKEIFGRDLLKRHHRQDHMTR